jgi:electron transfer flavoprotein beta subunit
MGMANMRTVMPALQKAKPVALGGDAGLQYLSASLPTQQRQTRVVKDMAPEAIAQELVEWMGAE